MSLAPNTPTTLHDWPSWSLDELLDELQLTAAADARDATAETVIREIRAELTRRAS